MDEVQACKELWTLVRGSHPFSGTNALYSAVNFVLGYPLGSLDVPTVSMTTAGGMNRRRGIGTFSRITWARMQLDVLAASNLEARRIYSAVRRAMMTDYQNDGGAGALGYGYLRGKEIRQVRIGEPSHAVWDEQGRVQRQTGFVEIEYLEGV